MTKLNPNEIVNQLFSFIQEDDLDSYQYLLPVICSDKQYNNTFQEQLTPFINDLLKNPRAELFISYYIELQENVEANILKGFNILVLQKPHIQLYQLDVVFQSYLNKIEMQDFRSPIYNSELAVTIYGKKENPEDILTKYKIIEQGETFNHKLFFSHIIKDNSFINQDFFQFYFKQFHVDMMPCFLESIFKLSKNNTPSMSIWLSFFTELYSQLDDEQQLVIKEYVQHFPYYSYKSEYDYLIQQLSKVDLHVKLKNDVISKVNYSQSKI